MSKNKYLFILRLNELDEVQRFRFKLSFFAAIFIMIIAPVINKYQGVYFTTQLITIIMILHQFSSKFLEKINQKFKIGELYKIMIFVQFLEVSILSIYFYDFKLMIYIYSFFEIFLGLVALSYGIKLTSLQAKNDPNQIKTVQIFKQNIWAEGFLVGLFFSILLQSIGIMYIVIVGILIRLSIALYLLKNWDFFDNYFKEKK